MTRRRAIYLAVALTATIAVAAALWYSAVDRSPAVDDAVDDGPTYRAGPFRLRVTLAPEAPRVGENTLRVELRDDRLQPVAGAAIEAVAEMPAMGAMPAMRAPAQMQEVEPGLYRGTFAPSMAGSWPLTLQIAHTDLGTARVTFDLATGRPGLRLTSGAETVGPPSGSPDGDRMADMPMPAATEPPGGASTSTPSSFRVDAGWQQAVGVRTMRVGPRELEATLRLPGRVTVDETRLVDVNLRTAGWIERLLVEETGQYVRAGERLLELYSPELVTAQRDLRVAIDNHRSLAGSPIVEARERAAGLIEASRSRLRRLGLSPEQVEEVAAGDSLHETLPILAPASGYVIEKMAVEGMRVEPGMRLFQLADLSTVWVLVDVYEGDAPFVRTGQRATFRLAYQPTRTWNGRVDYLYPTLDPASRSIRVRLVVPNPELDLRPEMYGDALLRRGMNAPLAIPSEAVLDLGTRQVVFVDLGDGRLQAREVALGPEMNGWLPVHAGLSEGESVVVSGNFLIDAESKVRGIVPLPLPVPSGDPGGPSGGAGERPEPAR